MTLAAFAVVVASCGGSDGLIESEPSTTSTTTPAESTTSVVTSTTALGATTSTAVQDSTAITLDSVTDGDTFRVLIGGASERVRIIGIDAPEAGDCLSVRATGRLSELLESGFALERDVSDRDGFGRLLRHVEVPDGSVSELLVSEGLAVARDYPPDSAQAELLASAHRRAVEAELGIWDIEECGDGVPDLYVAGDTVRLRNTGAGVLNLAGAALAIGSEQFLFGDTAALLPAEEYTIDSSCGDDVGRSLGACLPTWDLTVVTLAVAGLVLTEYEAPPAPTTTTSTSTSTASTTTTTEALGQADVYVSALRRDADGNDNQNKNDEWVEISNRGSAAADMTGWTIQDEGPNHTFRFPSEYQLGPGASVKVRSGCGTDTVIDLYWCNSGSAVWNNSGDTAFLYDSAGELVDTS